MLGWVDSSLVNTSRSVNSKANAQKEGLVSGINCTLQVALVSREVTVSRPPLSHNQRAEVEDVAYEDVVDEDVGNVTPLVAEDNHVLMLVHQEAGVKAEGEGEEPTLPDGSTDDTRHHFLFMEKTSTNIALSGEWYFLCIQRLIPVFSSRTVMAMDVPLQHHRAFCGFKVQ